MAESGSVDYWLVARCGQETGIVTCAEGESPTAAGVVPYGHIIVGGPYATWQGAERARDAEDAFRRTRAPNTVRL